MTRVEELENQIVKLDGLIFQLRAEITYKNKVIADLESTVSQLRKYLDTSTRR